jgi:hypothetical protein
VDWPWITAVIVAFVLLLIVLSRVGGSTASPSGPTLEPGSAGDPGGLRYAYPVAGPLHSLVASLVESEPTTVVRTYRGHQQSDVVPAFQAEAKLFADHGYVPTSQSWAPGQWGCGAFLIALLLAIVIIGLLIFLYLLLIKPDGTLTVVYARQAPAPTKTESMPIPEPPAAGDLSTRLAQLDAARQGGLITEDEYVAKRAAILDNL